MNVDEKSKRERVIELASEPYCLDPDVIAERLDMKIATVRSYVSTARGMGKVPPVKVEKNLYYTVKLTQTTATGFVDRAEYLGLAPDVLMARLLTLIARDDMFVAILDE